MPTGLNGHLSIRDPKLTSSQKDSWLHINSTIIITLTPIAELLAVELHVTTCFYKLRFVALGIEHPTFRLRGQRSNPLRHRRGFHLFNKDDL